MILPNRIIKNKPPRMSFLKAFSPRDSRYFPTSFIKRVFQEGEGHRRKDSLTGLNRLPTFWVRSNAISILSTPEEFYETLLKHSSQATDRVSLASLYLGTGKLEQQLLNTLADRYCTQSHLKVRVVMDGNRGTRFERPNRDSKGNKGNDTDTVQSHSAATLFQSVMSSMQPTSKNAMSQFRVGLFNMPLKPNDWFAHFILPRLPPRYNELLTTFHLKAYVFDDTLIMSGANLSNDYFTSRQDRYWVIQNASLANLYHEMIDILYDTSIDVNHMNTTRSNTNPNKNIEAKHETSKLTNLENTQHIKHRQPPTSLNNTTDYEKMHLKLEALMRPQVRASKWSTFEEGAQEQTSTPSPSKGWACIRPSIQCAALGMRHDETMTKGLMERLDDMGDDRIVHGSGSGVKDHIQPSTVYVSTGYLNFHNHYKQLLLQMRTNISIIAASPKANGFFTASGISSSLPVAYSLIAQRLYREAQKYARHLPARQSFEINEYEREEWTYHAKGLWFTEEQEQRQEELDRTDWYDPDDTQVWVDANDAVKGGKDDGKDDVNDGSLEKKVDENTLDGTSGGSLTLVGSPNFGHRSVERDFESSLLVVTEDKELRTEMERELQQLISYTSPVDAATFEQQDRKLKGLFNWSHGWWISIASRLVRGWM